jgi:hypothetical protein
MALVSRYFVGLGKYISILQGHHECHLILAVCTNFQSVSAGHIYGTTRPADKEDISTNKKKLP